MSMDAQVVETPLIKPRNVPMGERRNWEWEKVLSDLALVTAKGIKFESVTEAEKARKAARAWWYYAYPEKRLRTMVKNSVLILWVERG